MSEAVQIIPRNEYKPELELKVEYYLSIIPKSEKNTKKFYRTKEIETRDEHERFLWEKEEIRRIREGHFGLSGKAYFFYNYVLMSNIDDGLIRPTFRASQNKWFDELTRCDSSKDGWGLICVKRRRAGFSWMEAADVLHDAMTKPMRQFGMTSKTEQDAIELFKKVAFIYDNLPLFLRPSIASKTNRSILFGIKTKDARGNNILKGHRSEIALRAPTDTSWEGYALKKLIIDECFGRGTKVRMFSGNTKNIEDIRIGDLVMGHDSKPSRVESLTNGYSDLYKITPTKGEPFIVNGSHLLTLTFNGESKILDIKTREFYQLRPGKRRYYQLIRTGWEHKRKALAIDPYWLGLWLGDGYSTSPSICAADDEVKHYLEHEAPRIMQSGVSVNTSRSPLNVYYFRKIDPKSHGGVTNRLKRIKVWGNKHIPDRYLKANRLDRLRLLAGIIDSDGHKREKDAYEVTFKNKILAQNLYDLTTSLGFSSNIREKTATMKRKDGTVYKCQVYRVTFYGTNLHEIPCRVERKKVKTKGVSKKGRKTPERVGFQIEKIDDGEYFGITLDKNPYFLLHDGTIVHNCGKIPNLRNIFSAAEATMLQGTRRLGVALCFGTAGDVGKEGKELMEMWHNSDVYKLKKFFYGGWMGLDELVDEYGNDNEEEAIRWITYERYRKESLSTKEYIDFIQQFPLTVQEAFTANTDTGLGNRVKLEKQRNSLLENPVQKKKGYFMLDKDGKPVFVASPRGACIIYEEPEPQYRDLYLAGQDPTDHTTSAKDASSLSMFIMKKQHGSTPPKIVFEYTDRPNIPRDYYEQALCALMYYNDCKVMIERNKIGVITYFEERGAKHLIATSPQGLNRLIASQTYNLGYYKTKATTQYGEELIADYVENHYELIPSIELIEELQNYGLKNTDRVDALMAALIYLKDDKSIARDKKTVGGAPRFSYKFVNGILQKVYV